jgi:hypothetical protein
LCMLNTDDACGILSCGQCLVPGVAGYAATATSFTSRGSPVCVGCQAGMFLLNGRCVPQCPSAYSEVGVGSGNPACASPCNASCALCTVTALNAAQAVQEVGRALPLELDTCTN